MKKITYELDTRFKYSLLDMSFDFRIEGTITYRKKTYRISALKKHDGPVFEYKYYEKPSDKMIDILNNVSLELIHVVDHHFKFSGPVVTQLVGEIELDDKYNTEE